MKNTAELMAIIDDIAPSLKSSERIFIVSLILDEQKEAYKEAVDKAMDNISYSFKEDTAPIGSNPFMEV